MFGNVIKSVILWLQLKVDLIVCPEKVHLVHGKCKDAYSYMALHGS